MIYDCFTFFNELDILEIRLNTLKDVVDRFVLVEAGETHTGKAKGFLFKENESRFAEFKDRIIYVRIEKFPARCKTAWWRENLQRNAIVEGLKDARDDDTILISDIDEIPRPEKIKEHTVKKGVRVFAMRYYSFYLNYLNYRCPVLFGTVMVDYASFKHAFDGLKVIENEILPLEVNEGTTASKIRRRKLPRSRGGQLVVRDAGWHFTCLGGAKEMVVKMRAVSPHHDFNPDDDRLTEEYVTELIRKGAGPALKMNCFGVPLDDSFPPYVLANKDRYAKLIFPVDESYMRAVKFRRLLRRIQGWCIYSMECLCPDVVHNRLHLLKMRILGR